MPGNERGNDYFKHLDQPAGQPPARKARTPLPASQQLPDQSDYGSVPDPFGDASGETPAAPKRPPSRATPGLSPGIPKLKDQEPPPRPAAVQRSGVVLTPSGVKRRDGKPVTAEMPAAAPEEAPIEEAQEEAPAEEQFAEQNDLVEPSAEPPEEQSGYEASRAKNEQGDDVGWEEYAADEGAFPAVEAEELGVKTKTTDSGRIVPVAIRSDLTPEALKGKSIKGGGKHPRPAKKKKDEEDEGEEAASAPPKSWMGRIGQSLRMKFFGGKLVVEDVEDEEDEVEEEPVAVSRGGFPTSGSMAGKPPAKVLKAKKSARKSSKIAKSGSESDEATGKGAFSIIKTFTIEVVKIVLLVMLLRAYVLQVSEVKGPSMEPTMIQNDRLVVERVTALIENSGSTDEAGHKTGLKYLLPEFLRPHFNRGDMIVVRSPEDPGSELVKRLIALPGDTIKFADGKLWIKPDGESLFREYPEPYLDPKHTGEEDGHAISSTAARLPAALRDGRELKVPEERIFVMGDNRPHSNDSRAWLDIEVGKTDPPSIGRLWLHIRSIEGRVLFRIYPFDRVWPPIK